MTKQSILASLAFLKLSSDTNRGLFLDNFIPFVTEVMKEQDTDVLSIPNLQASLKNRFGLTIPHHVIKALLYRAKKQGLVSLADKVFKRSKTVFSSGTFNVLQEEVERIYLALIASFIAFAHGNYNVDFTEQEAEQAILTFISYNQLYIFQSPDVGKVIPDLPTLSPQTRFIVAQFVVGAKAKDPQALRFLDTIVKGYMIANVLYLPDVHNLEKRFRKTRVFLDTPFLLFALGYSGSEFAAPARELLALLHADNAQLFCFRHTVEEIKGILYACSEKLQHYQKGVFGLSLKYFTSLGYRPSDVQLLISHLERDIEDLGIRIVPAPDYSVHKYVIDEQELKVLITGKMQHRAELGIERDIASVSAIYRLRGDQVSYSIEETKAIFLTTNETLSQLAKEHYYRTHSQQSSPPCITDFELTNLIWLKTPNRAPDLPMKRIIADSYAAIQPDDELMVQWMGEMDKLKSLGKITEEDYYFMRCSNEAHVALMDSAVGQSKVMTEGNVAQIMERAKDSIREEAKRSLTVERQKRLETEARLGEYLAKRRKQEQDREDKWRTASYRFGAGVAAVLRVLAIALLVLVVSLSLPIDLLLSRDLGAAIQSWPRLARTLVFLALLVFGVYSFYFGESGLRLIQRMEGGIADGFYRSLKLLSGYFGAATE